VISFSLSLAAINWRLPFYWQLPILIVIISLVYSATRLEQWTAIFQEAFRWSLRMATFLASIAVVLYILSVLV
jgi:hypothetical protein